VRLAGSVAALAAVLRRGRPRIARHAVLRTLEGLIGMAGGARVVADIAGGWSSLTGLGRRLCLGNAQPAGIDRRAIEKGQPAREQQSGAQAGEELSCELMSSHAMTPRRQTPAVGRMHSNRGATPAEAPAPPKAGIARRQSYARRGNFPVSTCKISRSSWVRRAWLDQRWVSRQLGARRRKDLRHLPRKAGPAPRHPREVPLSREAQ